MSHNPQWLINKHPKDLKAQIRELTLKGYIVTMQDKDSAQLIRRKSFSFLIAVLLFLFFVIPFFLYLIWYLAKRDEVVYLDLAPQNPDPSGVKSPSYFKEHPARAIFAFFIGVFIAMYIFSFVNGALEKAANLQAADQQKHEQAKTSPRK